MSARSAREARRKRREAAPLLTPRQVEVLQACLDLGRVDLVAERLGLSHSTVQNDLFRVHSALGVSSRHQAIVEGLRRGLITLHPEWERPAPPERAAVVYVGDMPLEVAVHVENRCASCRATADLSRMGSLWVCSTCVMAAAVDLVGPAPSTDSGEPPRPSRFTVIALVDRYARERVRVGAITVGSAAGFVKTLRQFAAVAPTNPHAVKRRHVEEFVYGDAALAPVSRKARLSILRVFWRWLLANGYAKSDPTVGVPGVKVPQGLPRALPRETSEQLDALLYTLEPRTRVMVSLMRYEGCRRIELARMQVGDYERRTATLRVRGKGYRGVQSRALPVSPISAAALNSYIDSEGSVLGVGALHAGPMFRNRNSPSDGLTPDSIARLVNHALYDLGIRTGAFDGRNPHTLRHTMLTEALENGASLSVVQRFAGHTSPAMTHHYTKGATFDLREVHELRAAHDEDQQSTGPS